RPGVGRGTTTVWKRSQATSATSTTPTRAPIASTAGSWHGYHSSIRQPDGPSQGDRGLASADCSRCPGRIDVPAAGRLGRPVAWPSREEPPLTNPNDSDTSEDVVVASELRHASDALLGRLDRLYELELRKRELPPDDPEFNRLAREIEDVALSIFGHGAQQLDLAKEVARIAKRDDSSIADQAIRDIPPGPREATVIL